MHFVLLEECLLCPDEKGNSPVALIFRDVTAGAALAIILHFVDRSSLTIQPRLVRMQLLAKSLKGDEVARELLSVISTEYGVTK